MALGAIFADLAVVHIIEFVAAGTFRRSFLLKQFAFVTGAAVQFLVFAFEFKRGVRIVIEFDLLPLLFRMAITAFLTVIAVMRVMGFVAAMAVTGCFVLKDVASMAILAQQTLVSVFYLVISVFIVVEFNA